ncbi:MAG: hypothetical protein AAF602_21820 [Myxococcota bacterium]
MPPSKGRSIAANAVAVTTATGLLWGALFPGLAVADFEVGVFVFPFVAFTLLGWGAFVWDTIRRLGSPERARVHGPEVQRAFTAIDQLRTSLAGSRDLPEAVLADARRAVDGLAAEARLEAQIVAVCDDELDELGRHDVLTHRRAAAVSRLAEIGSAADDFLRQLQHPTVDAGNHDPVERLQAARRALAATSREVR